MITGHQHGLIGCSGEPESGLFGICEALFNRGLDEPAMQIYGKAIPKLWGPGATVFPFLWLVPPSRFDNFLPGQPLFADRIHTQDRSLKDRYAVVKAWLDTALVHVIIEMKK